MIADLGDGIVVNGRKSKSWRLSAVRGCQKSVVVVVEMELDSGRTPRCFLGSSSCS